MSLPRFSIQRPVFVSMFFLGICLIGVIALKLLPIEMMPNISFGHITIYINVRGGISASVIEKAVAKPVEEAVGSVNHLRNMLSISKEGNSTTILEFEPGTNMDFAALEVREKFNHVKNKLPKEIEKPVIAKYEYTDVPMMIIAVTSKVYSPEELRKIVEEKVKDKIQRVEGVARVEIVGGRESKILVDVNQHMLQALSLPINVVVDMINVNNLNLLAGNIKGKRNKSLVRVIGESSTLEDINNLAVFTTQEGSAVRIKDIAEVKDSYLNPRAFSRVNAQPSVSLYIQKESLANTVKVAQHIERELKELKPLLNENVGITIISNQAEYIKKSIRGVKFTLLLGAILAFFILFLFLRNYNIVFAIGITIPISILLTFTLMFLSHLTLNLMTLSGLALGVGMLMDNSIVVIENIFRKVENICKSCKTKIENQFLSRKENEANDESVQLNEETERKIIAAEQSRLIKENQKDLTAEGTENVLLAIVASTFTTLAVFAPLVFINKDIRILYSGLALTIGFSLCASLLCALTLIPLLISRIKIKPRITSKKEAGFLSLYKKAVVFSLRFRYLVILVTIIIFIFSLQRAKTLEKEFIGIAEQNKFTTFIELPTGTHLEATNDIVLKVENFINKLPEVKTVTAKVEPWSSKVYVELYPLKKRRVSTQQVISKARAFTSKLNAFIYFEEPQEVGTKEIIIEIFGHDYEILKSLAMQIGQRLQAIPKFTDTKIRMREGRPEILIHVDKTKAALMGLTVGNIALSLHTQLRGLVATRYRGVRQPIIRMKKEASSQSSTSFKSPVHFSEKKGEAKELETIVRLKKDFRETFQQLKRINFITSEGKVVYLSQIADISFGTGPSEIWRKNKSRMVQVSANTGGIALGTAAEKINEVLKDLKIPKNYFWQLGGNYEKMIRNQKELTFALILSIIAVYMILASLFESFVQPFIILVSVPLASIGAIFALKLTNKPISVSVLIGAILLGGIVVNNAIILIDRINFLKRKMGRNNYYIVIRASVDRLRPIIMTSLTTIAGMIFMALDRSESSNLWSPLAITVIGGMSVSSLLILFAVPSLYLILEDSKSFIIKKL